MKLQYNRKLVMQMAWLFVRENGMTLKEAQAASWTAHKSLLIEELLQEHEVTFTYKTVKDGSVRKAVGTSVTNCVNYDKKTARTAAPTVTLYWDFDSNGIRSFVKSNICKIISVKVLVKGTLAKETVLMAA